MDNTHRAALVAAYRTGLQSAGSALATSVVASQALTWGDVGAQALGLAIAFASAVVIGVGAGLITFAQVTAQGLPDAYQTAAVPVVIIDTETRGGLVEDTEAR